MVINSGTNNLATDSPDEISDGLICIAFFFQKGMKHLQTVVNGLIHRDPINTKRRQKLLEVNQLLRGKCTNYTNVYFQKPGTDWTTLDGGFNKTFYYKDNIHLLENGNKNLALSVKIKLDKIRENCREIKSSTNKISEGRLPEGNNNFVKKSTIILYHKKKYQTAVTEIPT